MQHVSGDQPTSDDTVAAAPAARAHWSRMYENWLQLGTPLRPGEEDAGLYARSLEEWIAANPARAPRGLILGVTPEIHDLPWPDRDAVIAIDDTPEMIDAVWPGKRAQVIEADWLDMPLPPASIDVAFCDGGLTLLPFPDGHTRLAQRLAEVVASGGIVAFRLFLPGERRESEEEVLAALLAGSIPNLNCLKLRLGPAGMASAREGVALHGVWESLRRLSPGGWHELAARLGWDERHLAAIDAYRDSGATYHFVTVDEVLATFRSTGAFELSSLRYPTYEIGERCPTITFSRR